MNNLNGIYQDIAENFGIEIAYMFFNHYKGLQITLPTRFLSTEFVSERIREEYNGKNIKDLTREYCYSERWIREFLKK